jgi:peptidoglycan/xylan/chitin deacetylase (PgdA/CDA1 family)
MGIWGRRIRRMPDPAWQFERLMALEEESRFRSSFYFVPMATSARRDPAYDIASGRLREIIGQLRDGGWEVGVHGSFRSPRDSKQLRRERERLEAILGDSVTGIRQHYLQFGGIEMFRAQAQAGYVYDTTVGYRETVGFRAGVACPFHPFDVERKEPLALLELPLTIMDGALFWHLKDDASQAVDRTKALLHTSQDLYGLTVLLWHQRVGDERRYPGWWQAYRQVIHHLATDERAWVTSAAEVARWWLAREKIRVSTNVNAASRICWSCHTPQAIEGLTLKVWTGRDRDIIVDGAQAKVETGEKGEVWIRLNPLSPGQNVDVKVN